MRRIRQTHGEILFYGDEWEIRRCSIPSEGETRSAEPNLDRAASRSLEASTSAMADLLAGDLNDLAMEAEVGVEEEEEEEEVAGDSSRVLDRAETRRLLSYRPRIRTTKRTKGVGARGGGSVREKEEDAAAEYETAKNSILVTGNR